MATAASAQSTPVTSHPAGALQSGARLDSIDFVRGLVIVLMALDHVRHFFSDALAYRPTNLEENADAGLFLARWVTHFCAPAFVFLAGTSAFLTRMRRGSSNKDLSIYLLTRGAWLIVLELTAVRCFGWAFNFDYHYSMGAILWALGWSMICLAALVHLPVWAVGAFGVLMIGSHNLFDGIAAKELGDFDWLWKILHQPGRIEFAEDYNFRVAYPLIPWIGVMAAGYTFGTFYVQSPEKRRRWLLCLGVSMTVAFLILRVVNRYGDPEPWSEQHNTLFTVFSFLNCTKYPPSLAFLLMTLGPAVALLAVAERRMKFIGGFLVTFGRVPLFFYLLHLPLIHGLAVICSYARYGEAPWLFDNPPLRRAIPDGYGYNILWVCLIWLGVVAILYPLCAGFARYKQKRRSAWLSYL